MKSYTRTDDDIRKEEQREKKKQSLAANVVNLECIVMFFVIYMWMRNHGGIWNPEQPILTAIRILIGIVLITICIIFIWAAVVHSNDYTDKKREILNLKESLAKERENAEYWKQRYNEYKEYKRG